jgi:hypothetical protein
MGGNAIEEEEKKKKKKIMSWKCNRSTRYRLLPPWA